MGGVLLAMIRSDATHLPGGSRIASNHH